MRGRWQALELTYTDFLLWAFSGAVDRFYADFRWSGFRDEIAPIDGASALSVYPFLWTEGPPIADRSRRAVPMAELYDLQFNIRAQLSGAG